VDFRNLDVLPVSKAEIALARVSLAALFRVGTFAAKLVVSATRENAARMNFAGADMMNRVSLGF
jgi:hypothetical protein